MKMKWFESPQTLEELKKQYKKLAMKYHPDLGGNAEAMKEINNEYEKLFLNLKDVHKKANGEFYSSENSETAFEFMDIIEKLIHMDGIVIEICGSWIWITGETKPHKDSLKALAFRWSNSKKAWYYHKGEYHKKSSKKMSLDDIRDCYGSEKVNADSVVKKIAIA